MSFRSDAWLDVEEGFDRSEEKRRALLLFFRYPGFPPIKESRDSLLERSPARNALLLDWSKVTLASVLLCLKNDSIIGLLIQQTRLLDSDVNNNLRVAKLGWQLLSAFGRACTVFIRFYYLLRPYLFVLVINLIKFLTTLLRSYSFCRPP